jgi:prefoldin subunit 5
MVQLEERLEQIEKSIQALDQKMDLVLKYLDKQYTQQRNSRMKQAMLEGGRTFKKG